MTRLAWPLAAALLLAACGASPDASASADASVGAEPSSTATGPVIELGEGPVLDTTWRYSLYPSDAGTCLVLEAAGTEATRCGDPMPAEGEVFGEIGWASPELTRLQEFQALEGFVTEDVATVWLIGEGGYRIPAVLVSLDEAGFDARGFVGLADGQVTLTHLQAVAMSGEILDTLELEPR